jgi:catecholate siderophore receptor
MKNRTFHRFVSGHHRPRKHGTSRLFMLGAAFASSAAVIPAGVAPAHAGQGIPDGQPALSVSGGAGQAGDSSASLRFDIRSGPLRDAITRFEELTHIKVTIATAGIEDILTPGVFGVMTPQQALDQMLSGTNVSSDVNADGMTLGIRGPSEFIAVAAERPRVPSPKYRATLRDTPQTVVVIPQQVFQEQNAMSLRDVLRNTPGITMSVGEGASGTVASGDQVLIRGFNARNDIYIDGARDPGEVTRDMFNVESVLVAKGPSSVTGGRSATGGSIDLVTKSANLTDSANVRFTGGSADHGRATVDVNRRLTGTVAFRLNALWQDAGYPGRDVQQNKSWGFAPSIGFGLNKLTQLVVSYSHLKQDNVVDLGLPTLLPDVAIAQGITVNDLDFNNFYGIASRDHEKTTSDVATAKLDHRFNSTFSLRNLTRYGKNFRNALITPPRPATSTVGQGPEDPGYNPAAAQIRRTDTKYQYRDDKAATNQTDLAADFGTGFVRHSADVGVEIARDRQPTYAVADLFTNGRPPVNDLFNPTPYIAYTPALARTGASADAKVQSAAAYAFDTISLTDHWQVDLGLRWDRVKIDYKSVAVNGVVTDFGRTDRALSGRSGLVFRPTAQASIYGVYSTSFTPSYDGTHGLMVAATGANSQALPPEKTHNIEFGAKWDPISSLSLTSAVFQIEKTNAKTVDAANTTVLAGDQRVRGVELGLSGNITPRWGTFAGLAVMNGKVESSLNPIEVDQRLAYVPHVSLNLWTTYRLPMNLTIGGGTNYSDGNYFNNTGGFNFVGGGTVANPKYAKNAAAIQELTKYWVFNAMAIYPLNRHVQFQVNANNLGDTKYADRAYDRHFLPGPRRQILFSPVFTF